MAAMIPKTALEDELGDVLEKAMKVAGCTECELAATSGVDINKIKDAIDYRDEFDSGELDRLARALNLNGAGLMAIAANRYPIPETGGLPFCLRVVAMPYGAGVVNAYIASTGDCSKPVTAGVLVDSGSCPSALKQAWPEQVSGLSGSLVTHWDRDHIGGCMEVMKWFSLDGCHGPGPSRPGLLPLHDGDSVTIGDLSVEVISTPGPAREHFCYLVGPAADPAARKVLFSGDLFFCGSIGGGFHDPRRVLDHSRRLWRELPGDTVVAPGHGPLTTIAIEREFNPFSDL